MRSNTGHYLRLLLDAADINYDSGEMGAIDEVEGEVADLKREVAGLKRQLEAMREADTAKKEPHDVAQAHFFPSSSPDEPFWKQTHQVPGATDPMHLSLYTDPEEIEPGSGPESPAWSLTWKDGPDTEVEILMTSSEMFSLSALMFAVVDSYGQELRQPHSDEGGMDDEQ